MNAGIINTMKFITQCHSIAVTSDDDDVLCVRWAHQNKEEFREEVAGVIEALKGVALVTLNDEHGAEALIKVTRQPDSYIIGELIANSTSTYDVLQSGYDSFESAQDALKNVKRRKTVKDPKRVIILGAWEETDGTEIEEPMHLPREEDFDTPGIPPVGFEQDEPEMATDEEVAGLSPSAEWVSFAKAAQILGVRYQQIYQRAVMRNRMRYMNHYSESDVKGHLYAHIEDVHTWQDERQLRLLKAYGAVEIPQEVNED